MVLDSLLAGIWFLNVYCPMTVLEVRASGEELQRLSTFTALGANFGYGFSEDIAAFGEYELNYNAQTQNVYLSGFDAGAKFYLAGGMGVATKNPLISAFAAPKNSLALSVLGLQREFNLTKGNVTKSPGGIVLSKSYSSVGSFIAMGAMVSFERVIVSQKLRLVADVLAARSLSVTTSIKFNVFQGRLGLTYQM